MPIEIPAANGRNIAIFPEEPDQVVIDEIIHHVWSTASPHTWRGHSHTKPPPDAVVVYIEEFDVPAPDTVERVAPCPCCNPYHPQYKNRGKIAWFPDEAVIRLIGPQCFAAINKSGHDIALVELRKRRKRREELGRIARFGSVLQLLIEALDDAAPIASSLDDFMREINRSIDSGLQLPLWREVKGGHLRISEQRRVPFRKPDGEMGERTEEHRVAFAKIAGHAMIDRSGQFAANKLGPLRAGLAKIARRLVEVGTPENFDDNELEATARQLLMGNLLALEIFDTMRDRQPFLTSSAIEDLHRWGQHPNAPFRFSIERKEHWVILSRPRTATLGPSAAHRIDIGSHATRRIPELPRPLQE